MHIAHTLKSKKHIDRMRELDYIIKSRVYSQ